jgi:signal recognition particle receptor subunit beta
LIENHFSFFLFSWLIFCLIFAVEKLSAGGRSTLTVWDLGGDSNFRPVWERYYREANIVVFVIDITSRTRLAEARAELGLHFFICAFKISIISGLMIQIS